MQTPPELPATPQARHIVNNIRFGLIGYGKVAALHVEALRAMAARGIDVVAATGRDSGKLAVFAEKHKLSAHASVEAMVREAGLDAVVVATPHLQHREHACAALAAGAHVIVEKPMALNVADCDAMIRTAEKHGRVLSVVSQRRWLPASQRVKSAIMSGKIGRPAIVQSTMLGWRDEAYYKSDPWRGSWAGEGGGVIVNQSPHPFDLLQWFAGPVEEVFAYWGNVNHPYIEVEDTAIAAIKGAGYTGNLLMSNSQKPGICANVHVHGSSGASVGVQTDKGAMFVAGASGMQKAAVNDIWTIPGEEALPAVWENDDNKVLEGINPTSHYFALQFLDFADALREGRGPMVSAEEGRATVALMEGIYLSGRERRPVRLSELG